MGEFLGKLCLLPHPPQQQQQLLHRARFQQESPEDWISCIAGMLTPHAQRTSRDRCHCPGEGSQHQPRFTTRALMGVWQPSAPRHPLAHGQGEGLFQRGGKKILIFTASSPVPQDEVQPTVAV